MYQIRNCGDVGWFARPPRISRANPFFSWVARLISVAWYCVLRGAAGPLNAPAAFIHPCQPIVVKQPPHELKHEATQM